MHTVHMCTSWKVQRIMAELTQSAVARRARLSVHRLRRIEQGIDKPKEDEAERLALAMPFRALRPQQTSTRTKAA